MVKFVYNRPEDYKIVYINGAYGGPTPRGDIHCHLFYEYPILPKEQLFEMTQDNKLGPEIEAPKDIVEVNRDLKVGLILKPEQAETIANWLLDKVKIIRGEKIEPEGSRTR